MSRIYFSVDIETDGLAPGINSMISLGAAAISMDTGEIFGGFKRNLKPVEGLMQDPDTMEWWKGEPEAYVRATDGAMHPEQAMYHFASWVNDFKQEHPVAAAWKPGFDLAFLRYYEIKYLGKMLFGRAGSGLDIKTVAALALGQSFSETQIGTVPDWMKGSEDKHNHDALDDAVEQAHVLYNALNHPYSKLYDHYATL